MEAGNAKAPGPQVQGGRWAVFAEPGSGALGTPCLGEAAAACAWGRCLQRVPLPLSSRRGGRRGLPGAVWGVLGECPPGACLEQPRATVTRRRARHFLSPDVHMSTRGQDLLRLAAPRPAGSLQSPWSAASSPLPPGLSTVLSRGSR